MYTIGDPQLAAGAIPKTETEPLPFATADVPVPVEEPTTLPFPETVPGPTSEDGGSTEPAPTGEEPPKKKRASRSKAAVAEREALARGGADAPLFAEDPNTQDLPPFQKEQLANPTLKPEVVAPELLSEQLGLGMFGDVFARSLNAVMMQKAEEMRPTIMGILKEEVSKLKPTFVQVPGRPYSGKIEGKTHFLFQDALFHAEQDRQLMLVGPTGSGKTTLAEQVAAGFQLTFSSISCSAGMSEAHLLGRMLFNSEYVSSDFMTAYENGGVFLFDEIDAADANTLLVINSALANGYVSVPNRKEKPRAERHPDFICIVAGNSWGNGSNTYQGRGYLDAAFLDRFALSKLEIDYDKELEKEIAGKHKDVLKRLQEIREIVKNQRMKRMVSTRVIASAVRHREAGKTLEEIVARFTIDWAKDEIAKITK